VKTIRKELLKEQQDEAMYRTCKKNRDCYLLQKFGFEGLLQWYKEDYVEKIKENNR